MSNLSPTESICVYQITTLYRYVLEAYENRSYPHEQQYLDYLTAELRTHQARLDDLAAELVSQELEQGLPFEQLLIRMAHDHQLKLIDITKRKLSELEPYRTHTFPSWYDKLSRKDRLELNQIEVKLNQSLRLLQDDIFIETDRDKLQARLLNAKQALEYDERLFNVGVESSKAFTRRRIEHDLSVIALCNARLTELQPIEILPSCLTNKNQLSLPQPSVKLFLTTGLLAPSAEKSSRAT